MSAFVRKVAFRYLRPSKKEGVVSVIAAFSFLGIMLGVATLIIVMSVMNGFREDLFKRILGFNGHIGIAQLTQEGLKNFDPLTEKVRTIEGVVSATPIIERQSMVSLKGTAFGALVHGIRYEDLKSRKLIADNIMYGSLDNFHKENAVVIGSRMAEKFQLLPGDKLNLVAPEGAPTAFGTMPRVRQFEVAAIFQAGMKDYDGSVVFIPLEAAQKFYRLPDAVSGLEVFVQYPDRVHLVTKRITETLGSSVRVIDWQQANSTYATALEVERNVMFIILTLIIVVAAFNIISSLIMLVKDKGQDIAILRTMGATQGMIMKIFFLAGSTIGVLGAVGGTILGLAFSYNIETIRQWLERLTGTHLFSPEIYFLTKLPAKVDPYEVTVIVTTALVLVFLASLYPSWRAARLDPVEALRYE